MLVLSYAVGLVRLDPERVIALRGLDDVVFKRPVHIGDTIRVRGRLEGATPLDGETARLELGWRIVNQSGRAGARARVHALWRLRPDSPAEPAQEAAPARETEPELREVYL
jgi:acyl dehydratase